MLKVTKRARYVTGTDDQAVQAFLTLSRLEGIIPALEPSHAISYSMELAKEMDKDDIIVVTLSGRGDKDVQVVQDYLDESNGAKKKKEKHAK